MVVGGMRMSSVGKRECTLLSHCWRRPRIHLELGRTGQWSQQYFLAPVGGSQGVPKPWRVINKTHCSSANAASAQLLISHIILSPLRPRGSTLGEEEEEEEVLLSLLYLKEGAMLFLFLLQNYLIHSQHGHRTTLRCSLKHIHKNHRPIL